jgi:hypothetical protein
MFEIKQRDFWKRNPVYCVGLARLIQCARTGAGPVPAWKETILIPSGDKLWRTPFLNQPWLVWRARLAMISSNVPQVSRSST